MRVQRPLPPVVGRSYKSVLGRAAVLLHSLPIQEITQLVSLGCGIIALIGGLVLLVACPQLRAPIELELYGFKIKTPGGVPAVVSLVGCLFIGFPLWKSHETQIRLPVSGKVHLREGKTTPGIVIGVLPTTHITLTQPDGSYSLNIPKAESGVSYQALVYFPHSEPPMFHMDVVRFNADGRGSFDHTLIGSVK